MGLGAACAAVVRSIEAKSSSALLFMHDLLECTSDDSTRWVVVIEWPLWVNALVSAPLASLSLIGQVGWLLPARSVRCARRTEISDWDVPCFRSNSALYKQRRSLRL